MQLHGQCSLSLVTTSKVNVLKERSAKDFQMSLELIDMDKNKKRQET